MPESSLLSEADPLGVQLHEILQASPKRIVFTDGEDLRVLQAAADLVKEELIVPILLGNSGKIRGMARKADISMTFIRIINPERSPDLELFEKNLERVEKFRGRKLANTREMLCNPHNYAAMMVQLGQADGLVAGNASLPASVFRSVSQFIKPVNEVPSLFGVVVLHAPHLSHVGSEGLLFMADCGVTPEPSVEQLSATGIETGKFASHFLTKPPKVAFLSHSTQGCMRSESSRKVAAATAMALDEAQKNLLAMTIVGEVQADVALDPQAAEVKQMSTESHTSDVIVFPNLDSAHIGYKLLQHVGGAQNYGQLILGLTKPAAQVPRTTSVETLKGTAALVGVWAVKGRELHLEW